jgi:hypothetical protein
MSYALFDFDRNERHLHLKFEDDNSFFSYLKDQMWIKNI